MRTDLTPGESDNKKIKKLAKGLCPQSPLEHHISLSQGLCPRPHPVTVELWKYYLFSPCLTFCLCSLLHIVVSVVFSLIIKMPLHLPIYVYRSITYCKTFSLPTCKGSTIDEKCLNFNHCIHYRLILLYNNWLWDSCTCPSKK